MKITKLIFKHIILVMCVVTLKAVFCEIGFSQNYVYKNISVKDGLPSDIVYHVNADSQGILWFASEAGVSSFNGKTFKNFNYTDGLFDNVVFESIKSSNSNKRWLLFGDGKLGFLKDGIFKGAPDLFSSNNAFASEVVDLPGGEIAVSYFGDGIRISKNDTVYHYLKSNGLADNYVSFIWSYDEGLYAISTSGISLIKDNVIKQIIKFEENIYFARTCQLKSGGVLFFSQGKQLLFENGKLQTIQGGESLVAGNINRLNLMSNGEIAVCSSEGVSLVQLQADSIIVKNQILQDYNISSITEDYEGNFWATSIDKGVVMFTTSVFTHVGKRKPAFALDVDDDILFAGYDDFTFAYGKNDSLEEYHLNRKNDYSQQKIKSFQYIQDTLWMMLDGGLASFQNNNTRYYRTSSNCFYIDQDSVLLGGKYGYWKVAKKYLVDSLHFRKSADVPILTKTPPRIKAKVNVLEGLYGGCFIGTDEGFYVETSGQTHNKQPFFKGLKVSNVFVSNDTIVITSANRGVLVLTDRDTVAINSSNSSLTDYCTTSYLAGGDVYVGTNRGFYMIKHFNKKPEIKLYSAEDGISGEHVYDIDMIDNKLFIATNGGVDMMRLPLELDAPLSLPLQLDELRVNEIQVEDVSSFEYEQNRFSFSFSVISFKYQNRVKMFYQLNDLVWVEFKGGELNLSNLSPGEYKLRVKADTGKIESEVWNYKFIIHPPFWKTTWFMLVVIGVMVLLVYLFFRIRVFTYNRDVVRELLLAILNRFRKESFIFLKNVKDGSKEKVVLNQIEYIKAANNYIEVVFTSDKRIVVRMTLKELMEQINIDRKIRFIRCHKSYVINSIKVVGAHSEFLKLSNDRIPIGKKYIEEVTLLFIGD